MELLKQRRLRRERRLREILREELVHQYTNELQWKNDDLKLREEVRDKIALQDMIHAKKKVA